jgi:hypothetical protein
MLSHNVCVCACVCVCVCVFHRILGSTLPAAGSCAIAPDNEHLLFPSFGTRFLGRKNFLPYHPCRVSCTVTVAVVVVAAAAFALEDVKRSVERRVTSDRSH